ncbi:unnamed protein product [Bursaphelenchus xylophilus]|uniref:(pine wood nematode) hypothetical protein n=1 Tax=Bursaphelenchus xylophilus TaxID=6326 RepID=A0A1I7RI09_BURXY|nr:unnamed protein product [Bursaphelenchus xylophilus]CAG9115241.1 unnamed protein product [Bursaphelenchus xylophilus]
MAKSSAYSKEYSPQYGMPRRRTVAGESSNHFSKDYWEKKGQRKGQCGPSQPTADFWMMGSEKQYRQEVFSRNSDNFYQTKSSYRSHSAFESPFTSNSSTNSSSTPKEAPSFHRPQKQPNPVHPLGMSPFSF